MNSMSSIVNRTRSHSLSRNESTVYSYSTDSIVSSTKNFPIKKQEKIETFSHSVHINHTNSHKSIENSMKSKQGHLSKPSSPLAIEKLSVKSMESRKHSDRTYYTEENEEVYPETLSAYIGELTDGIRYDLQDLWKFSVRYLFPNAYKHNNSNSNDRNNVDSMKSMQSENDLQNLEVKDRLFDDSSDSNSNDNSNSNNSNNDTENDEKTLSSEAVRRMRFPSTWNENQHINIMNVCLTVHCVNPYRKERESAWLSYIVVKKLHISNVLVREYLFLGQKKMIYVEKNLDLEGTANVIWWIIFTDLTTCMLSFQADSNDRIQVPYVNLQLGSITGENFTACMSDALTCAKVFQSIQERRIRGVSEPKESIITAVVNNPTPIVHETTVCHIITSQPSAIEPKTLVVPTSSLSSINVVTPLKSNHSDIISIDLKSNSPIIEQIEELLSPSSLTRANILARQLQFGVSELGLQMKLENEGIDENKSKLLISKANIFFFNNNEKNHNINGISSNKDCKTISFKDKITFQIFKTWIYVIFTNLSSPSEQSLSIPYKNVILSDSSNSSPEKDNNDNPDNSKNNTSFNKNHLKKYQLMLKHGVPWSAVETKMISDGVIIEDREHIRLVSNTTTCSSSSSCCSSNKTIETNDARKMITPENSRIKGKSNDVEITKNDKIEISTAIPTLIPNHLKKFQLMIKHGVPINAVIIKMKADGISEYEQNLINIQQGSCMTSETIQSSSSSPKKSCSSNSPNSDLPDELKKFQLMIKRGVPEGAVIARMKTEGISQENQSIVLSNIQMRYGVVAATGGISENILISPTSSSNSNMNGTITTPSPSEIPEHLKKYKTMIKNGVPIQAVTLKMTTEQISVQDQQLVTQFASDNKTDRLNSAIPASSSSSIAVSSSGPKLLGLHWEPLDKITASSCSNTNTDTLWKNISTRRSSMSSLRDDEMKDLVHLFARKELSINSKEKRKSIASINMSSIDSDNRLETLSQDEDTGRRPSQPSKQSPKILDFSRSMSISIVLTAFKSRCLDFNQIIDMIKKIDYKHIQLEDILRLKEILPTDIEIKAFHDISKTKDFDMELLVEPEKVLFKLSQINMLRSRVFTLLFLLTWESSLKLLLSKADLIIDIAGKVMESEGLEEIMQTVLSIGNAMNGGTWKGSAVGFRLSSLTKLNQTKSADGKCTVLDYMTQILYIRHQGGDKSSTVALGVDEELGDVISKTKIISLPEIQKDLNAMDNDCKQFHNILQHSTESTLNPNFINLQVIYQRIVTELNSGKDKITKVTNKIKEIEFYFGESTDSNPSVLTSLDDFLKQFKFAKEKYIAKVKKQTIQEKQASMKKR